MLYSGCKFMLPTPFIPNWAKFLFGARHKEFIETTLMNNDQFLAKIKDVNYLKKNRCDSITLWNCKDLPKQLNLVENKKKDKSTQDYFQNVILVIGSKANTPFNKKE